MRIKEYLSVEELIELLERRGLACDEHTGRTLMREGYYAVLNGYGKAFLDRDASRRAGEDRFAPGTTFEQVYDLFCFDRELRMRTFGELMRVEGMMRSVATLAFLDAHPAPLAYLDERSYTTCRHYLLGEQDYERHLRAMLRTLSRYANEHDDQGLPAVGTRLAHYQAHYDAVPLWVVFTEFSYGNLYHFVALMQKKDQEAACDRLSQVLGGAMPRVRLSRQALLQDLRLQVDVRNLCAHGERLYDAVRPKDFVRMMGRFLANEEHAAYVDGLRDLVSRYESVGHHSRAWSM